MADRMCGQVAVITGATSGIGLACAQRYVSEGAKVMGFDLANSDAWTKLEQQGDVSLVIGDVRDSDAFQACVDSTLARWGRLDVLLTAAGVSGSLPAHMLDEETWDKTLDVNLKGTFRAIKAVLPAMMEQRSGAIITIASIEGLVGSEAGCSYNASKGGVVLLSKNIAMDYARLGIRCNAICPGFIETPLLRSILNGDSMQAFEQGLLTESKMARLGKPEEVAGAAFFLASSDASYVNGQNLVVDGGYTAGHAHGVVEMLGMT